jgi:hypothetical protein
MHVLTVSPRRRVFFGALACEAAALLAMYFGWVATCGEFGYGSPEVFAWTLLFGVGLVGAVAAPIMELAWLHKIGERPLASRAKPLSFERGSTTGNECVWIEQVTRVRRSMQLLAAVVTLGTIGIAVLETQLLWSMRAAIVAHPKPGMLLVSALILVLLFMLIVIGLVWRRSLLRLGADSVVSG